METRDLPYQLKRLRIEDSDIVVARVDASLLRGKLQSVAQEIRKAMEATGHHNTVLLVLPSHMDVLTVPRDTARQALETLAKTEADTRDREQATKTLTRGDTKCNT